MHAFWCDFDCSQGWWVQPSYTWLKYMLEANWKKRILWLPWKQPKHRGLAQWSSAAHSRDSLPFPWKSIKSSCLWTDSTTSCTVSDHFVKAVCNRPERIDQIVVICRKCVVISMQNNHSCLFLFVGVREHVGGNTGTCGFVLIDAPSVSMSF